MKCLKINVNMFTLNCMIPTQWLCFTCIFALFLLYLHFELFIVHMYVTTCMSPNILPNKKFQLFFIVNIIDNLKLNVIKASSFSIQRLVSKGAFLLFYMNCMIGGQCSYSVLDYVYALILLCWISLLFVADTNLPH